jgi:hypothetical protein
MNTENRLADNVSEAVFCIQKCPADSTDSMAGVRIKLGVWCGHQPQSGKVFR